jgi:hypothetical protein
MLHISYESKIRNSGSGELKRGEEFRFFSRYDNDPTPKAIRSTLNNPAGECFELPSDKKIRENRGASAPAISQFS